MGHLCERCRNKTLPGFDPHQGSMPLKLPAFSILAGTGCCLARALTLGVNDFHAATNLSPRARLRMAPIYTSNRPLQGYYFT